jgi:hypothetical protein
MRIHGRGLRLPAQQGEQLMIWKEYEASAEPAGSLRRARIWPAIGLALADALLLGAVARPRRSVAATALSADQAVVVVGDTVRGGAGLRADEAPFLDCAVQSRFLQGGQIVFRMKVLDPETGQSLDDSQLSSLTLTLSDDSTKAFHYGGHRGGPGAQPTDYFWTVSWRVPDGYPTGILDFQVDAMTTDGASGSYQPFNVEESRVRIVPAGQR